ncbi:MAG: SPOR domain-containing protein [Chlorobi bacterium]|nr:SPOR domain-containing protein [Chlorobiota bacterium]
MEQYILDLIRENSRVIIPNFGAFIVAHENGVTILFNNFLTFNDGLLIDYVKEKENVDTLEATDRISQFVARINDTLETTGSYELKGLGKFTKDSNGILRFQQDENLNTTLGTDNTQETPPDNDELLDIEPHEEETTTIEEEEKSSDTPLIVPPVTEQQEEPPVSEMPETEKPKTTPSTRELYKEEKKKETVALFVILFVLIPVVGFALYYFIFSGSEEQQKVVIKQEVHTTKPVPKPVAQAEKPVSTNSGIVAGPESTVTEKTQKKESSGVATAPVVKQRRHFIIVGSFKDKKNAERYTETMKKKGFTDPVTIPRNDMYLVGVESFTSLTKALSRQEELLNQYKIESWILTVKP